MLPPPSKDIQAPPPPQPLLLTVAPGVVPLPNPAEGHKFCYRHGREEKENQERELRDLEERLTGLAQYKEKIHNLWDIYASIPLSLRPVALEGILHHSCFNQLAFLSNKLVLLTKVDFLSSLPTDLVCQKILNYLDAKSLCRATQVNKKWHEVADNDAVWRRMCSQHIDKVCTKCGWGLPLMTAKRAGGAGGLATTSTSATSPPPPSRGRQSSPPSSSSDSTSNLAANKRLKGPSGAAVSAPSSSSNTTAASSSSSTSATQLLHNHSPETIRNLKIDPLDHIEPADSTCRAPAIKSWKTIYAERSVVARNWRKPTFLAKNLIGHTDAVMSMYYCESKGILITGSADNTLRAWCTSSGVCLAILKGHTGSVRAVQFDDSKIISCSMDKTIRIWNLKNFECVRTMEGHTSGVVTIHFIDRFLASGSVDGIVRVWNLQAGISFTLVGHRNWVNKVTILPSKTELLSCSDDGTTILWDILNKSPIRTFSGHGGPVQSLALLKPVHLHGQGNDSRYIITGSLDHTIRKWDFHTGEVVNTLFGHTDGVWGVQADTIRIVSASEDKTIKVWDLETGACLYTIASHNAPVRSLWLSDTKLISGDGDGIVSIRDFCA